MVSTIKANDREKILDLLAEGVTVHEIIDSNQEINVKQKNLREKTVIECAERGGYDNLAQRLRLSAIGKPVPSKRKKDDDDGMAKAAIPRADDQPDVAASRIIAAQLMPPPRQVARD